MLNNLPWITFQWFGCVHYSFRLQGTSFVRCTNDKVVLFCVQWTNISGELTARQVGCSCRATGTKQNQVFMTIIRLTSSANNDAKPTTNRSDLTWLLGGLVRILPSESLWCASQPTDVLSWHAEYWTGYHIKRAMCDINTHPHIEIINKRMHPFQT